MSEENSSHRRSSIDRFKNALLLLCLLAPSIWMIATIPPLLRDADAYVQLTQDPRIATFWGHAPAYCYLAKIPLLLGEQWERIRGQAPLRVEESQPALTDCGMWLLIGAQHLSLAVAALFFITSVSAIFWMRLALVLIWASNALFYVFAHCVGSESLGVILIVFLVGRAVRLVQRSAEPAWFDWYCFAALLLLCMLTRDLNFALVALLPLAFLISATWNLVARRRRGQSVAHFARDSAIATGIGIACIAIAASIPANLARKTKLHPHSRFGYTFLWRLHSLTDLSPTSRAALLNKVSQRARSEEARRLIRLYEQMMAEQAEPIDSTTFINRAVAIFGGPPHWEEADAGLKQMALAFLWPPTPELWHATKSDFLAAMKLPPSAITVFLFATTAYYFEHKDEMPACANLSTFRDDRNAATIQALGSDHPYFGLWQALIYRSAVAVWLGMLFLFASVARRQRRPPTATAALAVALVAVGVFQFSVTCLVHDYEPRFSISLWELLLLSLFLLAGKTFDCLAQTRAGTNANVN
jgi:hypothetical protein